MVHRPPDSRLLTNLIDHEKDYAKHLASLFPLSHAALASLSAYAAAAPSSTPTSPAQSIAAVVDVLASADNALQRYTLAIDTWREQLAALKALEDDLAAILRDRDILVTRLIKASKSTRDAHRTSRLVGPLTNLGSASFSSLPSTNSTAGSGPASTNSKLAQAQAELQACEAHLVAKERELDARRITLARDALGARCRALIDCGWVWGEMGKQGLRALQPLSATENGTVQKPPSAIPPRLGVNGNPNTYASDNSSLTPSQSASQTAARSVETSHEGPLSKEHEHVQPETTSKAHPDDDGDLTLTLPPAHAIAEVTVPTSVRRSLENGDPTPSTAPAPARKRSKRPRRPPSQHIAEVSDEASDGPSNRDINPHTRLPTTTTSARHDTSSDDERSLQVVENDPFEMIRRSMIGPAPAAHASAPDVRVSVVYEPSPTKAAFPSSASAGHGTGTGTEIGVGPPPGGAKRQRRPSMAFFGSLRGLFRKPKERERVGAAWEEGPSSPSPVSPTRAKSGGWVTRTDARIKSRGGQADSDDDVMPTPKTKTTGTTTMTNVGRSVSGARLRKGRPSAAVRENGATPHGAGVDGWITDNPTAGDTSKSTGRSHTRRGTVKLKKTSVADLRGSDHGHTDGELDGRRRSLERASSEVTGKAPEASMPTVEQDRQVAADAHVTADPNPNAANPGTQHRRVTTTSRRALTEAAPAHRRSASMSFIDAHVTVVATSASTGGSTNMSWRKPPPEVDPPSAPSQSLAPRTHESQPKQHTRRHGHVGGKHGQNQSLMSIVADVTGDKARSMDIPRAPGSVLREAERGEESGRGHARPISWQADAGQAQGRGERAIKVPLRSALRNASRTPSPSPAVVPEAKSGRSPRWRDSASSISSYETVRESFDEEERERSVSPPRSQSPVLRGRSDTPSPPPFTFPPPPMDPPPPRGNLDVNADPNAMAPTPTSSTSTGTPPSRRKSVRVSLQPTFSPTPPALCDEEGDGHAPWSEGQKTKTGQAKGKGDKGGDVWADSSEEDEEYSRARRLLSMGKS
ncbi:hypothetical protein OG21DRAFT_1508354 [Imleria badia]|nr:hypothetical protein OG21DRAFT_1508354 [Imleria badia]